MFACLQVVVFGVKVSRMIMLLLSRTPFWLFSLYVVLVFRIIVREVHRSGRWIRCGYLNVKYFC